MFFHTDTADAPWTVIKSDCKKRARLNAHALRAAPPALLEQGLDTIGPLDPLIVGRASLVHEKGEDIMHAHGT